MSEAPNVLCAGRLYCDVVFTGLDASPAGGREVFADALSVHAGGGAFITAAYLVHCGLSAGVLATRPAPPFDRDVAGNIARAGVIDLTMPAPAGSDPQITVAFPMGGDRAFLTRRSGTALPVTSSLPSARHLHVGELTTALEHRDLIATARAAGLTVSLDCAWDQTALAREDVAAVIAMVDLFFPNTDEFAELTRHGLAIAPRRATIVKRGANGAEYRGADGATLTAPANRAEIRDLTGAGDAFNAGFLAAWLADASPERALALGNRMGAEAVGRIGGLPRAGLETVAQ